MKKRICDKCRKEIKSGEDYIKLQMQTHKDKRLIQEGVGDLCIKCYKETIIS